MSESIIRKLFEVQKTGLRRLDGFERKIIAVEDIEKAPFKPSSFDDKDEYRMEMRIGARFYANPAELDRATKIARRQCSAYIYSPLHGKLLELESYISDGDREACFEVVNEMRNMMLGD